MAEYTIEYHKQLMINPNCPPSGPYKFSMEAPTFEEATVKAVRKLVSIGRGSGSSYWDVWNAKIADSEDPENTREILRKGSWLVDNKTGELLEEKV